MDAFVVTSVGCVWVCCKAVNLPTKVILHAHQRYSPPHCQQFLHSSFAYILSTYVAACVGVVTCVQGLSLDVQAHQKVTSSIKAISCPSQASSGTQPVKPLMGEMLHWLRKKWLIGVLDRPKTILSAINSACFVTFMPCICVCLYLQLC